MRIAKKTMILKEKKENYKLFILKMNEGENMNY